MPRTKTPEAVLLIGIPATGKSSFARERLFHSHVRVSLDMVRTRHREELLVGACLEGGQAFVVDDTNASRAERARFVRPAAEAGFTVVGYYFQSVIADALLRNAERDPERRIPDRGVTGTASRLELPTIDEGFTTLYYVALTSDGFQVQPWREEDP